ncbi:flavin reductase family protein [Micromonospora matsumotoense]|uniref:flavin reductase family protein n=1 Tax=Micromonospora matsumotoense TaxID=121616 RepID=UPI003D9210D4
MSDPHRAWGRPSSRRCRTGRGRPPAPLISGALAWLECRLFEAHDSGDHTIFVGSVIGAEIGHDGAGLLFFGGAFHRIGTGSAAVSTANRPHTLQ